MDGDLDQPVEGAQPGQRYWCALGLHPDTDAVIMVGGYHDRRCRAVAELAGFAEFGGGVRLALACSTVRECVDGAAVFAGPRSIQRFDADRLLRESARAMKELEAEGRYGCE